MSSSNAKLGLALCSILAMSSVALATPVSVSGANVGNIGLSAPHPAGAGALYVSQNFIYGVMTFDLSAYAGHIDSGGTITVAATGIHPLTSSLNGSISLYALAGAYNVNSTVSGLTSAGSMPGTLLDTESFSMTSATSSLPISFNVSAAILQGWANNPSSNFGVVMVESNIYTFTGANHPDVVFASSGASAPIASFDVPEPASLSVIGLGMVALGALRRRSGASVIR
ncbi:MAG: PEP-CTERM sorting domain-containing protein [Rhodospirillales bacterium]